MKLDSLNQLSQQGLRKWGQDKHGDEMLFEGITVENWAWLWFQLRESEDRAEWFPSGKWATIQFIEERLAYQAKAENA